MEPEEKKIEPGLKFPPRVYRIERGMLEQFVRAVGDANPLWQDDAYAAAAGYAGATAPPTFVVTLGLEQVQEVLAAAPSGTSLHGSTELECYQPIRAGDTITITAGIENLRERQGKMGKMSFISFEITCENQRKELVARCRQMIINY